MRTMRIKLTSIMVNDQDKALKFYTEVLRFQKKHDIPVGQYKWLTVVSPEATAMSPGTTAGMLRWAWVASTWVKRLSATS